MIARSLNSDRLLSSFGAIELHLRLSVLDASWPFGDLAPGIEGLLIPPELEEVDAVCIEGVSVVAIFETDGVLI
jgi:hypothetical protein